MATTHRNERDARAPASSRAVSAARGGQAGPVRQADPVRTAAQARARALEAHVVVLFNQQRAALGLAPLKVDARLGQAAETHSADMLQHGYFAHDDAHGTWDARIRRYVKRSLVGEILSFGSGEFATPAGMVRTWMQSPEHRSVILTPDLRRVGLGVATGTYKGQDSVSMATADFSSAA
ncbi:MAG: hypothetical protein QOD65_2731 [Gaiellales bacterium]|nr:hypothetical protein [Gaiellales bacterium]